MTAVAQVEVEVRWLAGRGSCPGAVDLMTTGPSGTIEQAVTLSEALAVSAVIDLLCPEPTHLYEAVSLLAADHATPRRGNR
jgi:hypothetical protein